MAAFLVVAVAAGVLISGLLVPAAATASFLTDSGTSFYDDLPDEFEQPPLAEKTTLLAADGTPIAQIWKLQRNVIPIEEMGQAIRDAVVAVEDRRFYEHGGVDVKGTARAFVNNAAGGDKQGASTLTQQYVKNVLVERAVREDDKEAVTAARENEGIEGYQRKLLEARYAIAVEEKLTKDQILGNYLNISYFGNGAYGIDIAARTYFSLSPAELSVPQAAMLAGLVQRPEKYDPFDRPEDTTSRRNVVLAALRDTGKITPEQYAQFSAEPLGLNPQPQAVNGCEGAGIYAYFCDYVIKDIIGTGDGGKFAALGQTPAERTDALYNDGITVQTTIRPAAQQLAWDAVRSQVPETDRAGVALPAVEPRTGNIVAMAQNRVYGQNGAGQTKVNFSTGGEQGFQPGSTFKPFTLVRWLETGHTLNDVINASEPLSYTLKDYQTCVQTDNQRFSAGNAGDSGGSDGAVPVIRATFNSINTAFLRMAQQFNLCELNDVAHRIGVYDMGVRYKNPQKPERGLLVPEGDFVPFPSTVLGAGNVSPLAMAGAYATFAGDGMFCPPTSVIGITDRDGNAVDVPAAECTQAIDPQVVRGVNFALQQVPIQGTARRYFGGSPPFPIAGKTGTTNGSNATWFAGYTPHLAATVWVGDPGTEGTPLPLTEFPINGRRYGAVYGSDIALPTWGQFLPPAIGALGLPTDGFPAPGQEVVSGATVTVPSVVGTTEATARERMAAAGLQLEVSSEPSTRFDLSPGLIGTQSPDAGSQAAPGSTVSVRVVPDRGRGNRGEGRDFIGEFLDSLGDDG